MDLANKCNYATYFAMASLDPSTSRAQLQKDAKNRKRIQLMAFSAIPAEPALEELTADMNGVWENAMHNFWTVLQNGKSDLIKQKKQLEKRAQAERHKRKQTEAELAQKDAKMKEMAQRIALLEQQGRGAKGPRVH